VYWVEYDGDATGQRIKGREGYFNIDPILKFKARSAILDPTTSVPLSLAQGGAVISKDQYVNLPLDGLAILTVVSKWMGPIEEWTKHFEEASQRGYTMLHWTPLQERGESGSPYSIKDQLQYDPSIGGDASKVEEVLKVAKEQYGLLSLTDVVLNHTANDSPWLVSHPEAGTQSSKPCQIGLTSILSGFSPANSPHLTPAFELDSAMINFSSYLASQDLPTKINTTGDVDKLINAFNVVVKDLKLWQYYVLDATRERESVKAALTSRKFGAWTGSDIKGKTVVELAELLKAHGKIKGLGGLASRFGVSVEPAVAASIVKAAFADIADIDALADAWVRVVDVINVPLYKEWEEDIRVAVENVRNRVKYTRLDEHGPKLGEISKT
jgi:glycogen debranching enzyme